MDPLSLTGNLIAVLQVTTAVISICYEYHHGVTSYSRDLLLISEELGSLRDVLEALLKLVENPGKSKLETIASLAQDGGTFENAFGNLQRLRAQMQPETGWRKTRQSPVWPLKEAEVKKALEVLERAKSTMQMALSTDQASLILEIRGGAEDLSNMLHRRSTDQRRQDIYRWLAAPDPSQNHLAHRKKRQPNTGMWLLRSKQYKNWLSQSKSFLWLYGIPGSGKTILCSTVIEHLLRYCQKMPKTVLVFFYFDFNDSGKRDNGSLIRSLITQLASQCDAVPQQLLELYATYQDGEKTIDEERITSTLRSLFLMFHNVYIVFDALDEVSDSAEILELINIIQGWELSSLHLLVTSRQLTVIEDSFGDLCTENICLQESKMKGDIILYIAEKLKNDKKLSKWPPDIKLKIESMLLEEEDGMFQWVVCQLDILERCLCVAAVREALSTGLPRTLHQTYDHILSSVDESYQVEVSKVLMALTATVNPLTLEDIVEILAVDLEASPPRFDPDLRLLDPRNIMTMCTSLVTASSASRWTIQGNQESVFVLRLAHASVSDYLTQDFSENPSSFHFSKQAAKTFLANTCLTYLMNPAFRLGHKQVDYKSREKDLVQYPFIKHCVANWPMYLRDEPGKSKEGDNSVLGEDIKVSLRSFFNTSKLPNGGNFAYWVGMLMPYSPLECVENTRPLYCASSFGLTSVVRLILKSADEDLDIDALGGRARSSALHVAVYRNHIDVVKMLLEHGADPNLENMRKESPAYWAHLNGNWKMQILLYENGAKDTRITLDKMQYTIPTDAVLQKLKAQNDLRGSLPEHLINNEWGTELQKKERCEEECSSMDENSN